MTTRHPFRKMKYTVVLHLIILYFLYYAILFACVFLYANQMSAGWIQTYWYMTNDECQSMPKKCDVISATLSSDISEDTVGSIVIMKKIVYTTAQQICQLWKHKNIGSCLSVFPFWDRLTRQVQAICQLSLGQPSFHSQPFDISCQYILWIFLILNFSAESPFYIVSVKIYYQNVFFLSATALSLNVPGVLPTISSNLLLKCWGVLKPHRKATSFIGRFVNSKNFFATIIL